MRLSPALLIAALISTTFASAAPAQSSANTNASPAARAVLRYLQSLESRTNHHLLSGQFSDFGSGASLALATQIQQQTGQRPGILGVDYADFPHGSITCTVPNRAAIDYWRQGGLVTVSAHLYNPANPNGGGLRDKGVNLETLLDPASETHTRWMHELDLIADGLQQLKDAGVVVLWRPFHEMNGGWFWWGGQDTNQFIRLWRHMFDYFSQTRQLDNLLWVYAPNHGDKTAAFYPGDQYVDLVGLDAYTDFIDPGHIHGYAEVARLNKPFGFTEFGPHGPERPPGDYDYLRFLQGVRTNFPKTGFFMSWNANWSLATNQNTRQFLNDPWVANAADLPKELFVKP